jgi:hypothetical protein
LSNESEVKPYQKENEEEEELSDWVIQRLKGLKTS